jgi:hypothetical protein
MMYEAFADELTKIAKRKGPVETGLPKPRGQATRMKGVGLGKDGNGYFVYTHRAGSDSYPTPEAIPDRKVKFIESTG